MSKANNLKGLFGNIDIYLFDQLLKGTYDNCTSILDAGCGTGRNIIYFLKNGYDVYGVDSNPQSLAQLRDMASVIYGNHTDGHFWVGPVEEMPFEDQHFDLVISSAVLHFAQNQQHFENMLYEMWRVLRPGGYFFCRLASNIGIESAVIPTGNGRYILPDGTERFLVNQQMLLDLSHNLNGSLHEPIKTTVVQGIRSMSTWCLKK